MDQPGQGPAHRQRVPVHRLGARTGHTPMSNAMRIGRREFLTSSAAVAAGPWIHGALSRAADETGAGLLAPSRTHHEPKARNLLIVFLTGGFSHVDTFDYKSALNRYDGKQVPSFGLRPDE